MRTVGVNEDSRSVVRYVHSLCLDGVINSSVLFQQLATANTTAVTQALTIRFADYLFDALLRGENYRLVAAAAATMHTTAVKTAQSLMTLSPL